MPKYPVLSFCYQIELYLPGNALFIRLSRNFLLSLCNSIWHFFCKSVWHFTLFPKPLPKSGSHMHHTRSVRKWKFPVCKTTCPNYFFSFFSSFRYFCHVLCDFYSSFQVPKPPVFAASRFSKAIYCWVWFFFSFFFFKTKKPHLRGIPWNKVSGGFMVFLFSFFCLSFCLTCALFRYFHGFPLPFGNRKASKEIAKKVAKESACEHFYYSNSTKTNAFCLGIILCNVSRSFDYLIYPYYPAYTS